MILVKIPIRKRSRDFEYGLDDSYSQHQGDPEGDGQEVENNEDHDCEHGHQDFADSHHGYHDGSDQQY